MRLEVALSVVAGAAKAFVVAFIKETVGIGFAIDFRIRRRPPDGEEQGENYRQSRHNSNHPPEHPSFSVCWNEKRAFKAA